MVSFFHSLVASACGNFCVCACLSVSVWEEDTHLITLSSEVSVMPIVYAVVSSQLAAVFTFYVCEIPHEHCQSSVFEIDLC